MEKIEVKNYVEKFDFEQIIEKVTNEYPNEDSFILQIEKSMYNDCMCWIVDTDHSKSKYPITKNAMALNEKESFFEERFGMPYIEFHRQVMSFCVIEYTNPNDKSLKYLAIAFKDWTNQHLKAVHMAPPSE